jgi:hypothetical protein
MTLEEVQKAIKEGRVNIVEKPDQPDALEPKQTFNDMAKFIAVFNALRKPKLHLTAAPTFTPKNFMEQIQFYDDGTNRRIYLFINNTWRYATLT